MVLAYRTNPSLSRARKGNIRGKLPAAMIRGLGLLHWPWLWMALFADRATVAAKALEGRPTGQLGGMPRARRVVAGPVRGSDAHRHIDRARSPPQDRTAGLPQKPSRSYFLSYFKRKAALLFLGPRQRCAIDKARSMRRADPKAQISPHRRPGRFSALCSVRQRQPFHYTRRLASAIAFRSERNIVVEVIGKTTGRLAAARGRPAAR